MSRAFSARNIAIAAIVVSALQGLALGFSIPKLVQVIDDNHHQTEQIVALQKSGAQVAILDRQVSRISNLNLCRTINTQNRAIVAILRHDGATATFAAADCQAFKLKGTLKFPSVQTRAGAQGTKGVAGPAGIAGKSIQGPPGKPGLNGTPGPQGPAGPPGKAGATGPTGVQGKQGPSGDGTPGPKGDKGDTGDTGASGPTGPKGDTGDTGPKGDTGAQGPQGPQGDTGPPGPATP